MNKKSYRNKWNDYFKRHEKRGFELSEIKNYLINLGYNITHIDELIYHYKKKKIFNILQLCIYIFLICGSFICFFYMKPTITGMGTYTGNSDHLNLGNNINILFVDINNLNCDDSHSRSEALDGNTPWCTINRAFDLVQGGDTIYILNGTYNDRHYLHDKSYTEKITFSAYPGNNATLIHSYDKFLETPNNLWENISHDGMNIWKTNTTTSNLRVSSWSVVHDKNGKMFYIYDDYNDFDSNRIIDAIWADDSNHEIYIKFIDSTTDPRNTKLYINHIDYGLLRIENVKGAEVVFINLTIQFSRWQIYIINSINITIDNNDIKGGTRGVYAIGNIGDEISDITIKNNNISGYFDSNWAWEDIKGTESSRLETSAINAKNCNDNIQIINNDVNHWFNGIFLESTNIRNKDARIYNNRISDIYDDAFELEDLLENAWIYNNNISDAFVTVSMAYGDCVGLCKFYNNIVQATKEITWNSEQNVNGECFKIGRSGGQTTNWDIHHNTCYGNSGIIGLISNSQDNNNWTNNIFHIINDVAISRTGLSTSDVYYNHNVYYKQNGNNVFRFYNDDGDSDYYDDLNEAKTIGNWDGTWDINSSDSDPQFNNISSNDFRPISSSPACNMSTTGSYVGALPCIGQIHSFCGDTTCDNNESCNNCQTDCGICINETFCGDTTCDNNESCNTCEADCGVCINETFCGDTTCDNNETCNNCQTDCGICPTFCGDTTCDNNESCNNCEADCGACPIETFCGDTTCDNNESCNNCEADCGTCPIESFCGDNTCDNDESCETCATDCGTCKSSSSGSSGGSSSSSRTVLTSITTKTINFTNKSINLNSKVKQNIFINLNENNYKIKLFAINSESVEFIILDNYYEFKVGEEKLFLFNNTNVSFKLTSKSINDADFKITKQIQEKQIITQKQPELKIQDNIPEEIYEIKKTNKTVINESPKIIEKKEDNQELPINNFTIIIFLIISISIFSYSVVKSKKSFDWFIKKDNKKLKNWIKLARKNNYTDHKIVTELTKNGWQNKIIKEMMKK
jgi:hypothetical protein